MGSVIRKPATCTHCGGGWLLPAGYKGLTPLFCPKPRCQDARRIRRNEQIRESKRRGREREQAQAHVEEVVELDTQVLRDEIDRIVLFAREHRGASRADMTAAVRKLAYAEGVEDTYDRLLELAATATSWAARIRPGDNNVTPDFDQIPALIEATEDDYDTLMAA